MCKFIPVRGRGRIRILNLDIERISQISDLVLCVRHHSLRDDLLIDVRKLVPIVSSIFLLRSKSDSAFNNWMNLTTNFYGRFKFLISNFKFLWSSWISDEERPDYDVSERLKRLNEDLKNEQDPGDREAKVGFKEDPVDLVVPPATFSDDEDSKSTPRGQSETSNSAEQVEDESEKSEDGNPSESQSLVERDGKFEFVSEEDYRAEERKKNPSSRPQTANETSSAPRSDNAPRSQSAGRQRSKYGLTDEQKKMMIERHKAIEKQKADEEKRKREEEEERRKENECAFKAWLERKREQAQNEKNAEKNTEDEGDQVSHDFNFLSIQQFQVRVSSVGLGVSPQRRSHGSTLWVVTVGHQCVSQN